MVKADILAILKSDLDIASTSTSKDAYLNNLIDLCQAAITREGVTFSNPISIEEGMLIEAYSAFIYRRRKNAGTSTDINDTGAVMPRSLRFQINNLLIQQKAGTT